MPTTNMSEVFVAASAEPDLPASPVQALLTAYWRLIADDDTWRPWRESCDYLENSLNRALQLQAVGRSDAQLDDAWHAHLDTLQNRLPHVTAYEGQLASVVELGGTDYCTLTSFRVEDHASSLAAGEYIDRYLRGVVR